jgi:hypothetical protein
MSSLLNIKQQVTPDADGHALPFAKNPEAALKQHLNGIKSKYAMCILF